ncbi:unnamed protein product [Pylaiella littoralis]
MEPPKKSSAFSKQAQRPPPAHRSNASPAAPLTVCALVENRARETCIAVINTSHFSVIQLSCIQDSQSYARTLAALQRVEPDEILLHDGTRGRVLSSKVVGAFHGDMSRVLFVSRQYFDQDKGAELLKRLASGSVDADLMSKYTALAASYCLIRYVENAMGLAFADVSWLKARGRRGMEHGNIVYRGTPCGSIKLKTVLRTKVWLAGSYRFLPETRFTFVLGIRSHRRCTLKKFGCRDLSPPRRQLDLVTFFLTMEGVFTSTLKILGDFMDLDRMLSDLVTVPKQVTPVTAGRSIATLICLRHTLRLLEPLANALEDGVRESKQQAAGGGRGSQGFNDRDGAFAWDGVNGGDGCVCAGVGDGDGDGVDVAVGGDGGSPLLKAMLDNFRDPCLDKMLERLDAVLTESTSYSKNPAMMRHQECFAVRPDVDGMLDVARQTFLQSMEDIYQAADAMTEDNGYQVKVACSVSRGYHLVIPAGVEQLPPGLIQAVQNTKTIACTTEEVSSLSDRANEAVRTALLITHDVIQALAGEIRAEGLDALFSVTESLALLDMIFGFADLVTLSPLPFCRPEVTPDGPMSIRGGRHPIVGAVQDCKFVPNDTYMSPFMNFRVVTGPNNSGKSTYLKQAGLIVLMAQMGCFVPAEMAVIPVRDSLLSRIGTGDDMENNVSTFLMEMREVAQVLERVTSRSLVMIDELGRGTSNREGMAVAWAVAERLLSSSAYTLFVTHYAQVPGLADLYPNVKNIHLQTAVTPAAAAAGAQTRALRYLHKALEGRCDPSDGYGIRTAEMCGLPCEIVEEARIVREQVVVAAKAKATRGSAGAPSDGERDAHELLRTLATLKGSTMDPIALREFLHVLSLEYGNGPKGAGILASLHPPESSTAAADADAATPGGGLRETAPLQGGVTAAAPALTAPGVAALRATTVVSMAKTVQEGTEATSPPNSAAAPSGGGAS